LTEKDARAMPYGAAQASDVYELDETGYNCMGQFEVKPGKEEDAKLGASWCPEEAISIIE